MKNLLILVLMVGCIALGALVAMQQERIRRANRTIAAQRAELAELWQQVPPRPEERERQFSALMEAIENFGSTWRTFDDVKKRLVSPVQIDAESHT